MKSVLEQFSPERVRYVLANTIQQKDFDGRIPVSYTHLSQTDGKELPDIIVDELKGTVENYEAFLDALRQESPVPISFEDIPGGAQGFFSPVESRIAIQAVSYTHLDVYKRQLYDCLRRNRGLYRRPENRGR